MNNTQSVSKYILLSAVAILLFPMTGLARTNCDNDPKPAFGCPTGYTIMCIPVGGDHWGCGKENAIGQIEETDSTSAALDITAEATARGEAALPSVTGEIETGKYVDKASPILMNATNSETESLPTQNTIPSVVVEETLPAGEATLSTEARAYIKMADVKGESSDKIMIEIDGIGLREAIANGKVEVRGWDLKNKKEVTSVATIETQEQLALVAAAEVNNDARIESLSLNFEKITMDYQSQGKLLGFIPISFRKNITVTILPPADEQRVKVKFPWYGFLITPDVTAAELEESITTALDTETELAITEDAAIQAKINHLSSVFSTVSNVMKTKHDTVKNSIQNIR